MSHFAHILAPFCVLGLMAGVETVEAAQEMAGAPGEDAAQREAMRYATCLERAKDDPDKALALAGEWQNHGGGLPADHCIAVALMHQDRFAEAARRLAELAGNIRTGQSGETFDPAADTGRWHDLIPELLAQAGNAWLLAGRPDRAESAFDRAIATLARQDRPRPAQHTELLIDRARALAAGEDYQGALADLEMAQRMAGDRADLQLYRASALRRLDRLDDARVAVDRALDLEPDMPAALLERGNIRQLAGDGEGARDDWMAVLSVAPGSAAARAAQENLARLELSENDKAAADEGRAPSESGGNP